MFQFATLSLAATIAFGVNGVNARVPRRRQAAPYSPSVNGTAVSPYINGTNSNITEVALQISTKDTGSRNDTAPYLYGLMIEDINHSLDGGLYGELLTNRAFQGSNVQYGSWGGVNGSLIVSSENKELPWGPVLTGWAGIGNVRLSLDNLHPLSDALRTVLEIDIAANATGEVGFENYGWWGMDVRPQTYTASFYALANAPRYVNGSAIDFKLAIRSNKTNEIWASSTVSATLPTFDYKQYNASIVNTATAPDGNNKFTITMDASQVAGRTLYFDLISLFPETFKNRPNGLRKDLAEAYYDMKPRFLRFPGGNNLEGVSVQTRWKWWKTIGPLKDRPGRPGDWSYYNTDGLGYLEFLEWCEDMEITPVLAIYAGFSLDVWGQEGTSWSDDEMDVVLQEALDEIEYATGDTNTKWGAVRASHGHPEPFDIKFIEIGNEDWFSGTTYEYRFPYLLNGLKAKYPDITYISTQYNEDPTRNQTIPAGCMWDTHHYEEPHYFIDRFNFYDNWQEETGNKDVGVLLGEYSVFQIDTPEDIIDFSMPVDKHIFYPRLLSAIGEGVYALGAERNPDVVRMSSYAPSLQNFNWYNWTPNMIAFAASWNDTVLSASYWQQWMFARFHGTQSLPVENSRGDFNPLFWAASIDEPSNAVYLKVINSGNKTVPLTVDIDAAWSTVNGTILTHEDVNAFNYLNNKTAVTPKPLDLGAATPKNGSNFAWTVPAYSIIVLQFDL